MSHMQPHAVHEGDVEAAEFAVGIGAVIVETTALNGAAENDEELAGTKRTNQRLPIHSRPI